jgi:hypothetical protein
VRQKGIWSVIEQNHGTNPGANRTTTYVRLQLQRLLTSTRQYFYAVGKRKYFS